jgi:hypothetical protein
MSKIKNVHDTFLHFLADNLTGIKVRELMFDKDDMTSRIIQTNALNVEFTNFTTTVEHTLTVVFDLAHNDTLTARDWEEQIVNLLHATAMTEVMDYRTDPANPKVVPQQRISWPAKLSFRPIVADTYYHSTATFRITYS